MKLNTDWRFRRACIEGWDTEDQVWFGCPSNASIAHALAEDCNTLQTRVDELEKALPALQAELAALRAEREVLIRVARAAERWSQAEEFFADKWNTELEGEAAGELAEAEVRLEEALQQLRDLEVRDDPE